MVKNPDNKRKSYRSTRGSALIALIATVVLAGVIAVAFSPDFRELLGLSRSIALGDVAKELNTSSAAFVTTGGSFSPDGSAQDALLLIQTPVDETSRKAGLGIFPLVDFRWTLQSASSDGARITYKYDPEHKRPFWGVASEGPGFTLVVDKTRAAPEPADWSARVDRAGSVGARKSNWVWDYSDVKRPNTSNTGGGGSSGPQNYTPPVLSIAGPVSITVAGTYSWTGMSSTSGALTIDTGDGFSAYEPLASSVASPSRTFAAGDNLSFTVSLQKDTGEKKSLLVTVKIPTVPTLSISGPKFITDLGSYSWQANSSVSCDSLFIQVENMGKQNTIRGNNVSTISTAGASWPADTHKTLIVRATALNGSAVTYADYTVTIDIPAVPVLQWLMPSNLEGGAITKRGSYTFQLVVTNFDRITSVYDNSPSVALSASSSFSGDSGIQVTPPSSAKGPASTQSIVLDTIQVNADSAISGDGAITLDGRITTLVAPGGVNASTVVPIHLEATAKDYTWTAMVQYEDGGSLTQPCSIVIEILHSITEVRVASFSSRIFQPGEEATFSVTQKLTEGSYIIRCYSNADGYSLKNELALTITP